MDKDKKPYIRARRQLIIEMIEASMKLAAAAALRT